jgi:hypothetical protein
VETRTKEGIFTLQAEVGTQEYIVGKGAMVMVWPNPLCVQLYPAPGWEGCNYLIEKLFLLVHKL